MEKEYICSACNKKGDTIKLQRKNDVLACPKCGYSFTIEGISPLGRYQETWKDNSHFLSVLLRPELPSNIRLEPGLNSLYEDCYQTLLIGRYNASIVMMGLFLEALMKERIRLKTGKDFTRPYGACIKRLRDGYLIDPKDIAFLDKFRDKVRNTYAHFDEMKVVDGRILRGWEIPFEEIIDPTKFEATLKAIKSGKRKPLLLYATHPALRSMSKLDSDRKIAVGLFNLVYDFTLGFVLKYLRQKDYNEHNKNYPHPFIDLSPVLKFKTTDLSSQIG
jgi:DNA-directed RNA polymerase subunit RPC12/RpoP